MSGGPTLPPVGRAARRGGGGPDALARWPVAEPRGAADMSTRRSRAGWPSCAGRRTCPAAAEMRGRAGGRRFRATQHAEHVRRCGARRTAGSGLFSSASRRQPVLRRVTGKGTPWANAPGGGGRWGACGNRSACRSCTAWWCKRRRGGRDLIVFSCSERLATGQFHLASARGYLPVFCPARVSGCLPRAFRWSSPPRPFITSSVLLGLCILASVGPPGMCRRVGPRSSPCPAARRSRARLPSYTRRRTCPAARLPREAANMPGGPMLPRVVAELRSGRPTSWHTTSAARRTCRRSPRAPRNTARATPPPARATARGPEQRNAAACLPRGP